jgi:hypothetical protein
VIEVRELQRLKSPATYPQGVAIEGTTLWIGSCETHRLYAVDMTSWAVRHEAQAPGEPFGITAAQDELRVILGFGEDADDRYIYRFTPERGFDNHRTACPELSGAFLAFDGERLFLSQAWNKKILVLTDDGNIEEETSLDRRPVGMTFANGALYLITTDDDWQNRELVRVSAGVHSSPLTALASIPFSARGLAFDGSQFWTTHRENSEIVALAYETAVQ